MADTADPIERIGKSVTILAAIIGVVISVNTLVTSRAKTHADTVVADAKLKAESFSAFRAAVTRDEQYWQALYDQFLTIFGKDFPPQSEARRAKVLALYTLAQHPLPTFDEFAVPATEKTVALQRLSVMQAALLNNLEEQGVGDTVLADELARRSFKGKAVDAPPSAPPATPPPAASAAPTPSSPGKPAASAPAPTVTAPATSVKPNLSTATVQLSPPSATGWDIDVFWCEGANAAANRAQAMALGNRLAPLAVSGRSIAPGVTLGRIRVRAVPLAYQQIVGSPAQPGAWIIHDTRTGELEAAQALQSTFNSMLNGNAFQLRGSSGVQTRWYLSAFVCLPAPGDTAIADVGSVSAR